MNWSLGYRVRVSSFSKGSVIAISAFAAIFLATMYQVGESLTKSRTQFSQYQTLKSLTTVKFNRTIAQYLQNGDASLLTNAEAQLTEIVSSGSQINVEGLSKDIDRQANTLMQDIKTKYRAMGKLSGDPLALLRNGEQSLVFIVNDLAKYAHQSSVLTDLQRLDYLMLTSGLARSVSELVNSREKMFLSKQLNTQSIDIALQELANLGAELNRFPSLEIFAESDDDDDFFDDEDEIVNGLDAIREIPTALIQGRYDVVTPVRTAWRLKQLWPQLELNIVPDAGHASSEPGISAAITQAAAYFAKQGHFEGAFNSPS